jgi:hypothetical protein
MTMADAWESESDDASDRLGTARNASQIDRLELALARTQARQH